MSNAQSNQKKVMRDQTVHGPEQETVREGPGGSTLGISGWGCVAGTLEALTYTRATSSAEFCYPILE